MSYMHMLGRGLLRGVPKGSHGKLRVGDLDVRDTAVVPEGRLTCREVWTTTPSGSDPKKGRSGYDTYSSCGSPVALVYLCGVCGRGNVSDFDEHQQALSLSRMGRR